MKKNSFRFLSLLTIISVFVVTAQAQVKKDPMKGFDSFVEKTMQDWNVPAVSIAIVKDGEVLLTKGYGFADVEGKRKADATTLFAIGSSTKAFTAAAVLQLVDEQKIDLDKPVIHYLPDFKLYDDYATNHITTRDLLTHRSGLPRHDFAWYGTEVSREQLYQRLRYLEPTAELREKWQYQNLMYMTAGILVGKIEGDGWEKAVRTKILKPLGMLNTNLSIGEMQRVKNHALPYQDKDGAAVKMDFRNIDAIGPAGSINSNAVDMAKWLQCLLNDGKLGDKEILSSTAVNAMYQPQMTMPGGIAHDELFYNSYGLGWMISSYRGHLSVEHGGNIDGFTASVCFMPRDGFGVVVLSNMNATILNTIIRNNVIDRLSGLQPKDWNSIYKVEYESMKNAVKVVENQEDIIRVKNTKPSFALKNYTGNYENKGYGILKVIEKDKQLMIVRGGDSTVLTHYHFDVFQTGSDAGKLKVHFEMNVNGELTNLNLPLEPALGKPIEFTKLPEVTLVGADGLKLYEGKYVFPQVGQTATVKVKGEELTVTIPGQPTYTLTPYKTHQFNLKGLEGYSMKFTIEGSKATKATFIQPNGSFTFEREE